MYFTQKQLRVLNFIRTYVAEHSVAPTLDEMAEAFGVSKVTVFHHVKALEKKGVVRHTPHLPRSIEILDGNEDGVIWCRGTLGLRGLTDHHEPQQVRTDIFAAPRGRFDIYRIEDESLSEAGVLPGDYVVVDPSRGRSDERLLVSPDGNSWTVTSKDQIPPDPFQIAGALVAVLRIL